MQGDLLPLDALERVTMKPDIPEQDRAKNEKDDKVHRYNNI